MRLKMASPKLQTIISILMTTFSIFILASADGKRLYCHQGVHSIDTSTASPATEFTALSTRVPADGPKRFIKDMCCENKEISSEKHTCCMGAKVLKKHFKCCVSGLYAHKSASCECTPPKDWLDEEIKNIGELAEKSKQLNMSLQRKMEKLETLKKLEEDLRKDLKIILSKFEDNEELRIVHSLVKCLHDKEADNIYNDVMGMDESLSPIQQELKKIRSFFKRRKGFSFISNRMDDVSKESSAVAQCWKNEQKEKENNGPFSVLSWSVANMFGASTMTESPKLPEALTDSAKNVVHKDLNETENKLGERIKNLVEISLVVERIENEIKVLSQMEKVFIRSFTEAEKIEEAAIEQEYDDELPILSRAARSVIGATGAQNKKAMVTTPKPCNISGWQYTVRKTQELLRDAEEKMSKNGLFD